MLRIVRSLFAVLVAIHSNVSRLADEPIPNAEAVPPADQFLVIPIRLHILKSDDFETVDCKLSDDDLRRILGKVNGIWNKAGIHWGLESIISEPANRSEKFRLARELDQEPDLAAYRWLIPDKNRQFDGLHVYYLHDFSVNGVWLGENFALVKETAKLREVEGGIDEPIPRVTAHELGHILGLPHRQDRTNLLASGTTGTILNEREVKTARAEARMIPGVRTYRELSNEVKAAGDRPDGARLRAWLNEINKVAVGVKPADDEAGHNPPLR